MGGGGDTGAAVRGSDRIDGVDANEKDDGHDDDEEGWCDDEDDEEDEEEERKDEEEVEEDEESGTCAARIQARVSDNADVEVLLEEITVDDQIYYVDMETGNVHKDDEVDAEGAPVFCGVLLEDGTIDFDASEVDILDCMETIELEEFNIGGGVYLGNRSNGNVYSAKDLDDEGYPKFEGRCMSLG